MSEPLSKPLSEPGPGRAPSGLSVSWREPDRRPSPGTATEVVLECGWGRLVFGQTFADQQRLLETLRAEQSGRRDICIYVRDPHVLVSLAPHELFVDPSYTYRRALPGSGDGAPNGAPDGEELLPYVAVRELAREGDAEEIDRVCAAAGLVRTPPEVIRDNAGRAAFTYLLAEDRRTGEVVGTVTGVDHVAAFGDPELGSSLWCLAVDPQCALPRVGEALVRALAAHYSRRGRAYLDLSVLHSNAPAIRLYEKLGFDRVPVFCVKRKNDINEPLFVPPDDVLDQLNPYARLVADEARRRGVAVEVLDVEWGELRLTHGGRALLTRESLSELTTAVAMGRCDDKRVTRRIFERAGLRVPRGRAAVDGEQDARFLAEVGELVVKPARGEQGAGITVGVSDPEALGRAVRLARSFSPDVLLEERVAGEDLRIVVIDAEVVAAAVRRPAAVVGTGQHTIAHLIEAQSRRRAAATGGESRIPLDEATAEVVRDAGYGMADVLPAGVELVVRRTANLHTGGTIADVTPRLHPALADAAVRAAVAIGIPVTGLDLLVPAVDRPDYVLIEANERPGLANHEPQPTAERFLDLLFPATSSRPRHPHARSPEQGDRLSPS